MDVVNSILELYSELQANSFIQRSKRSGTTCELLFDEQINEPTLRKKTEQLFKNGHYMQAVEAAYKLVNNIVKKKSGITGNMTGSKLMQHVFSPNNPILKFNEMKTTSEQDEQLGYMNILSGCMTGIRNPRSHESDWDDTEHSALQLLIFANHLLEKLLSIEG